MTDDPAVYFVKEMRMLASRSDGAITMEGDAEGDMDFILYPAIGALEVGVKSGWAYLAWGDIFIEDERLEDIATSDRLLAICESILKSPPEVRRSGGWLRRRIETDIPLTTRGLDSVWTDTSIVYFDFGRSDQAREQG